MPMERTLFQNDVLSSSMHDVKSTTQMARLFKLETIPLGEIHAPHACPVHSKAELTSMDKNREAYSYCGAL